MLKGRAWRVQQPKTGARFELCRSARDAGSDRAGDAGTAMAAIAMRVLRKILLVIVLGEIKETCNWGLDGVGGFPPGTLEAAIPSPLNSSPPVSPRQLHFKCLENQGFLPSTPCSSPLACV